VLELRSLDIDDNKSNNFGNLRLILFDMLLTTLLVFAVLDPLVIASSDINMCLSNNANETLVVFGGICVRNGDGSCKSRDGHGQKGEY